MRRLIAGLAATCLLLTACSAKTEAQKKRYNASFLDVFDTVTNIVGFADSESEFEETVQALHEDLLHYHRLFDIYNDYEGVPNLKTVNEKAGVAPVKVDAAIIDLLKDCKTYYDLTDGRVNVAMGSVLNLWHEARTEGIRVRQMGVSGIVQAVLPGFVPQIQHTAHGGVDPPSRQRIISLAVEEQVDDGLLHLHRLAGVIVDGLQVVQPFVFIVNIKKLVVVKEHIVDGLGLFREAFLTDVPTDDGGDGVEDRQEGCGVLLLLLPRPGTAAQQHRKDQKQRGDSFHPFRALAIRFWNSPILMVTEVSRSASVGLVVSSTAMPATSSAVLPVM